MLATSSSRRVLLVGCGAVTNNDPRLVTTRTETAFQVSRISAGNFGTPFPSKIQASSFRALWPCSLSYVTRKMGTGTSCKKQDDAHSLKSNDMADCISGAPNCLVQKLARARPPLPPSTELGACCSGKCCPAKGWMTLPRQTSTGCGWVPLAAHISSLSKRLIVTLLGRTGSCSWNVARRSDKLDLRTEVCVTVESQ